MEPLRPFTPSSPRISLPLHIPPPGTPPCLLFPPHGIPPPFHIVPTCLPPRSASDLSAVNALLCRAEASAEADAGHLVLAGDGSAAALPFSRAQPWIDAHFGGAVSVAGIATSLRTRRQELAESSRTGLAKGGAEAGGGGDQDEVAWLDGTIALLSK
eukprot:352399-Chlamydomonas_euryale.AAC.11